MGMTCKGGIAGTKVAEGNSRREGGNSKCSSGEGGLTAVAVSGTPEEDEDFEADLLTPLTVVAGCDTTEEAEDLGEEGLTTVAVSGTPEEDEDFEADLLTPLTAVAGCDTTEEAENLETDVPLDTKEKGKGLDAEAVTEEPCDAASAAASDLRDSSLGGKDKALVERPKGSETRGDKRKSNGSVAKEKMGNSGSPCISSQAPRWSSKSRPSAVVSLFRCPPAASSLPSI